MLHLLLMSSNRTFLYIFTDIYMSAWTHKDLWVKKDLALNRDPIGTPELWNVTELLTSRHHRLEYAVARG